MADNRCVLAVDVGTTSVKVVLVDGNGSTILEASDIHNGYISGTPKGFKEQDPHKILIAFHRCLQSIDKGLSDSLERDWVVSLVVVTCQMHGVVGWGKEGGFWNEINGKISMPTHYTSLITWEDGRADGTFLDSLPTQKNKSQLSSGFGCVSLAWLARHQSGKLVHVDHVGSIGDFVIYLVCGGGGNDDGVFMTDQMANSWGYYDAEKGDWEREKLSTIDGFPLHLMPQIAESYSNNNSAPMNVVRSPILCIPKLTPIYGAFGDLQTTLFANDPEDAIVINVGTSAQACCPVSPNSKSLLYQNPTIKLDNIEVWPYFDGQHCLVAASMNGGNVLNAFVETVKSWMEEFISQDNTPVTVDCIWRKLTSDLLNSIETGNYKVSDINLSIIPTMFGERSDPSNKSIVITFGKDFNSMAPTKLCETFESLIIGIVDNLCGKLFPYSLVNSLSILKLICSGLASEPWFKPFLERYYIEKGFDGLDFVVGRKLDASYGAAKVGLGILNSK